jgi:hypothetical protein
MKRRDVSFHYEVLPDSGCRMAQLDAGLAISRTYLRLF